MRWLLLALLTFAWAVQVEAFDFGTIIGQYNAGGEAAPTEWLETFENANDKTWTSQNSTFTYVTSSEGGDIPMGGTYSLKLLNGTTTTYVHTAESFPPSNTVVFATKWTKSNNVDADAEMIRFRVYGTWEQHITLSMKGVEVGDIRLGTDTGTSLGYFRPECSASYYYSSAQNENMVTQYLKVKLVQDATTNSDELYVWVSEQGSSWDLCYSSTTLEFPITDPISNIAFRIGSFQTDEAFYYDDVKITTDGSDTSDY